MSFLDSKRIVGTDTQRTGQDTVSGGWKEVGRTTLESAGDTIDVSSLPDKRYYMVLQDYQSSGTFNSLFRINNATTDNSRRWSLNGASSDGTGINNSYLTPDTSYPTNTFRVAYIANLTAKEKLMLGHQVTQNTAGAGTAPDRAEVMGKKADTSNPVDSVLSWNTESGSYNTGSEIVVLGYDPDDTHTDNFWEQLADVTLSSTGDNLSSGTITAKKYLWIQTYISDTGGQDSVNMTFNNDTGNNYAFRRNNNGGTDATTTSTSHITLNSSEVTEDLFSNVFIINNSSNEKLVIGHTIQNQTLGAGTAPIRKEFTGKWTNTSSQITEIDFDNDSSGSYDTNSFIKVWGSN